jgi:hypothetical protein
MSRFPCLRKDWETMKPSSFVAGLMLAGVVCVCRAQTLAATADNQNVWLNYVGDHPLFGGPLGLHLEVQNRLSEWGRDWQQLLIRPGINYQFTPNWSASLGYGFVRTYPYGELPVAHRFDEHRIYEQLQYKQDLLGLKWTHRLRLEQRWIEELQKQPDGRFTRENWRGEQRVRYLLRTEWPLTEDRRFYVPIWNEAFFNFGGNIVWNHFDQNRAFIGLGWQVDKHVRLETGFMEQTVKRRGGQNWENNHTLSVWLSSNLPFFDGFR